MEGAASASLNGEIAAEGRIDGAIGQCYRLFNRQRSIHQIIGGGKAADVILWKRRWISFAVMIAATFAWFIFERSGLSFLTISCDVLLILIVIQFVRANSAVLLDKQLQPLPELVLSEEMVNNAAAAFRVKINNMLMMAHDITLGKDFRIFFQVVGILWLLSVIGGFFSFFTLSYIVKLIGIRIVFFAGMYDHVGHISSKSSCSDYNQGIIVSFTIPALYDKFEDPVDRCAGFVHRKISKHYKIVDENVIRRIPRRFSTYKEA